MSDGPWIGNPNWDAPGMDDPSVGAAAHAQAMHQLERAQERAIARALKEGSISDDEGRLLCYGCGLNFDAVLNLSTRI